MTVYLIHFNTPYHHAKHYLGFTDNLARRLAEHRAGTAARLTQVVNDSGITWRLARLWDGDRSVERKLKNQHNSPRLCPVCNRALPHKEM